MTTDIAELRALAKQHGIDLGIHKGNSEGVEGEITLEAPDGFQFGPEFHGLVIRQGRNEETRELLPWDHIFGYALADLRANLPLAKCPDDCPCKE